MDRLSARKTFRRQSDLKRHKCLQKREKQIEEQQGEVQCMEWINSAGGLAVHRCVHRKVLKILHSPFRGTRDLQHSV